MTWSQRRQLFIAGIIFAVLLVIAFLIALPYLNKKPTCFDGRQNGTEIGKDCGGNCEMLCSSQVNNLTILWARVFPVSNDLYNAMAYVENSNAKAGIKEISYQFDVYDKDGIFLIRKTGSTYIPPNGKFAIFEGAINVGNREPKNIQFKFTSTPVWYKTKIQPEKIPLFIKDKIISNADTTPKLAASISNESLQNIPELDVVAILFDSNDNAVAIGKTYIDNLLAGSSKQLFFTWPKPFSESPVRIDIIPKINVFSADFGQ
ncbi:MAG: hypothetical protein WDK96_03550 [Candidatus Paceibacterota bacterium]|jgi:hypothetical protein